MYDAAFKIIRFNPRATVGAAVVVAAAAMVIPVAVTAVLSVVLDLSVGFTPTGEPTGMVTTEEAIGAIGAMGSLLVGTIAQSFGLILVTGMVAHVTMAAAVGRRLSLGEAWKATHGSRWRLIALALLIGLVWSLVLAAYTVVWVVLVVASVDVVVLVLWGVLSVPALIAGAVWAWTRLTFFAVPALMLERTGVLGSINRTLTLTRRQFWRTFGIALLTLMITQVAASILTVPISLVSQLSLLLPMFGDYQLLVFVLSQALGTIVAAAFVSPFTAAVTSLQYVDQRMRKEAFDVELMSRAGITAA